MNNYKQQLESIASRLQTAEDENRTLTTEKNELIQARDVLQNKMTEIQVGIVDVYTILQCNNFSQMQPNS
jgi:hypothetical protein